MTVSSPDVPVISILVTSEVVSSLPAESTQGLKLTATVFVRTDTTMSVTLPRVRLSVSLFAS